MLTINGNDTTDPYPLSEEFAEFFSGKVDKLSNSEGRENYYIGPSGIHISVEEVIKAGKNQSSKLCSGEDGISMRIVKDLTTLGYRQKFLEDLLTKSGSR